MEMQLFKLIQKQKEDLSMKKNLQKYIRNYRPKLNPVNFNQVEKVYIFETKGYFFENNQCYSLKMGDYDNGRRDTELDANEVKMLVDSGQKYLSGLSKEDGSFVYGYFSCFDREINYYNMLRHSSTIYSMIEAYEFNPTEEAAQAIKNGIDFF